MGREEILGPPRPSLEATGAIEMDGITFKSGKIVILSNLMEFLRHAQNNSQQSFGQPKQNRQKILFLALDGKRYGANSIKVPKLFRMSAENFKPGARC